MLDKSITYVTYFSTESRVKHQLMILTELHYQVSSFMVQNESTCDLYEFDNYVSHHCHVAHHIVFWVSGLEN